VSPTEVEAEVLRHPQIIEAVAFAVPNIAVGEDIACAYTTEDSKPVPEHALLQFLKSALPSHMVPSFLLHFESFPITGNAGKLDRKTIKQSAFARLGLEAQQPEQVTG
jgi:non-ribosomal peptide synthetase component E (peptide arylation enzyme)